MRPRTPVGRWVTRGSVAAFAAAGLAVGVISGVGTAQSTASHPVVVNPYSPAYHHSYRHGAMPTISTMRKMNAWYATHTAKNSTKNLDFGGGIDGIGVTTGGTEKVYLVFYGSQWGTASGSGNNISFSHDPTGEAPYLEKFFTGLGTGDDSTTGTHKWSGVMTQYCQGVATGVQHCPTTNHMHVNDPATTGGSVLAGVWADTSAASPSQSNGHELGVQAVNAAAHFGNTTAASNRLAQYDILSPTGTHPDGFNTPGGGFCAWHDYNGDTTLTGGAVNSPYGDIAFTNEPYVTDAGASCGQNFVNSSGGTDDGDSIVNGHEYAETITDQNPAGGWTDSAGEETGDLCAWKTPGTAGGSFDLHLGDGTFAVQTTWNNSGNHGNGNCAGNHAIVSP